MPKRPQHTDSAPMARWFRERMAEEQQRQGISDAGLAKRAGDLGVKMTAATVWKIKAGTPPRKVDLDEAHALARALGFDGAAQMLHGPDAARLRVDDAAGEVSADLGTVSALMQACRRPLIAFEHAAAEADPGYADEVRQRLAERIDEVLAEVADTGGRLKARMRGELTDAQLAPLGRGVARLVVDDMKGEQ